MRANPINPTVDFSSNALVPLQGRREGGQSSLIGVVDTRGLVPSPAVLPQEGIPSPALSLVQQTFGASAAEGPVSSDRQLCEYSGLPSMKVYEFVAQRLHLNTSNKLDVQQKLLLSLSPDLRTEENINKITKALDKTVDPSGAIMLFVDTDQGVQLLQLHSQRPRRGHTVQTNGTCAQGESIRHSMTRRFFEETGNPPVGNILNKIVSDAEHRFSLALLNRIGDNPQDIATRMINNKAIYLNMSASYLNPKPVDYQQLVNDVNVLNQRLADFSPFYAEVSNLLFASPAKDLSDPEVQAQAQSLIRRFEEQAAKPQYENAPFVTREAAVKLDLYHQAETNPVWIKKALTVIADLTEHDELGLMSRENLELVKTTGQKLPGFFDAGFAILGDCLNEGPVAELFKAR